ncbi:MAG TPA: NAD(P)H-binding protein, partial [Kiritimatiellia bacterium]|nr:NAD(P)H-binding protein [Kiritimatiellia bacterium]
MNLLIAGAGGVLGRELVRQALARGDHVGALVLRRGEIRIIEHPRLRIIEADVTQPGQIQGICKGFDQVISCIGITRIKGKLTHEAVDYQGNLNLLEDAKHSGVSRFGFISPAGVPEGWDQAPLLNAKHRFEQALQKSGVPWVIFRSGG